MNNYATNENKRHSKTTKKRSKPPPMLRPFLLYPACLIYAQPIILLRSGNRIGKRSGGQPAGGRTPTVWIGKIGVRLDTVRSPRSRVGSPIESNDSRIHLGRDV